MSDLNPLQLEAIAMLARGESATAVRSQLELPQTTFADWRADPVFDAAVQAERERLAAESALDPGKLAATGKAAFRRGRR